MENENFTCELYGKTFKGETNFMQHKATHNPENKFTCEFCEKVFSRKVNLIQHKVTHDLVKKIYSCHMCQKNFSSKGAKTKHVKNEHSLSEIQGDQCKRKMTSAGSFAEFEIIPETTSKDLISFLREAKFHVCEIVKEEIKQNRANALQCVLSTLMTQNDIEMPVHFASDYIMQIDENDIPKSLYKAFQKIKDSFEEYMESGFNWQLVRIIRLNVCSLNFTQF